MDGVSGAASILQLAEMAGKTALELYNFVSIIKNAPEEINGICRDIRAFYALICSLNESLQSHNIRAIVERDSEISRSIQNLHFPLDNCRSTFDRVINKLKPHLKADPARFSRNNVMWYFRRREIYALAMELERSKATFGEAMGSITLYVIGAEGNTEDANFWFVFIVFLP